MNRALLHIAALALPLLGLGATWLSTDRASRQGVEWEVPVRGYDPRDFLQGHYVMFQYDWPGLERDLAAPGEELCIEGQPPRIERVRLASGECAYRVSVETGPWGGRLYVAQDAALKMQQKLADPKLQGVLRFRLRPDGQIVPLGLTLRPRPAG
ncbi:MAG: hypothetical protein RL339_436 [Pseudomonadota bacterium]